MDANKLKSKLIEKGRTISTIADLMNIHESSLYRKINGGEDITVYEAIRLKEILGLTNNEASDIFLSKE